MKKKFNLFFVLSSLFSFSQLNYIENSNLEETSKKKEKISTDILIQNFYKEKDLELEKSLRKLTLISEYLEDYLKKEQDCSDAELLQLEIDNTKHYLYEYIKNKYPRREVKIIDASKEIIEYSDLIKKTLSKFEDISVSNIKNEKINISYKNNIIFNDLAQKEIIIKELINLLETDKISSIDFFLNENITEKEIKNLHPFFSELLEKTYHKDKINIKKQFSVNSNQVQNSFLEIFINF